MTYTELYTMVKTEAARLTPRRMNVILKNPAKFKVPDAVNPRTGRAMELLVNRKLAPVNSLKNTAKTLSNLDTGNTPVFPRDAVTKGYGGYDIASQLFPGKKGEVTNVPQFYGIQSFKGDRAPDAAESLNNLTDLIQRLLKERRSARPSRISDTVDGIKSLKRSLFYDYGYKGFK